MPHYPGHLREAFLDWIESDCPDTATVEEGYEPQVWPAERLLGVMWNCSDIMPGWLCELIDLRRGTTYARAARGLKSERRQFASL